MELIHTCFCIQFVQAAPAMSTANISGSDDQMDIEEDENQPVDPMFHKNQQTIFSRPPPKIFGQNPMPSNDFQNKDNSRASSFDDISNSGNPNLDRDRENDMNHDFRGRGVERERDRNRRDYSNERGSGRNNSRWNSDGRGRSRENDRITPSDGNNRDFNNSRNNMQWRDAQPNFTNNTFMEQPNPRMNMGAGPLPALEDLRLPIPIDNMRGGPIGPNGTFQESV